MASKTPLTELIRLAKQLPGLYNPLRKISLAILATLRAISQRIFSRSRKIGPASGFYFGYDQVRCGKASGGMLFERQNCPLFPENSLVRRSGLGQDTHQPWPLFWMEIPQARLCGRSLVPRNPNGHLLAEATFSQRGDATDPAYDHLALHSGRLIHGNATSIVSRWGGDALGNRRYGGAGYWHWLFDSISRLSLMEYFPSDTRVITPPLVPWMRWFLAKLDLNDRIIETEAKALRVERFYFSSPSSMTGCWNPYAVDFLRRSFLTHASPPSSLLPKRFYIIREGYTRGIANEQEVRDYFQSAGWALIAPEKLSIPDQIALFRDAESIAGLHGSALTNLLWCSPGASVIEFTPINFMSGAFEWLSLVNRLSYCFKECPAYAGGNAVVHVDTLHSFLNEK